MSPSRLHDIVIGDPTHPDCPLCQAAASGEPLRPSMNRAERRAAKKRARKEGYADLAMESRVIDEAFLARLLALIED